MKRLYIGLGKDTGLRPRDVAEVVQSQTELSETDIGPIHVSQRHSTVEVPAGAAKKAVAALSHSKIHGRKAKVRLDRH
jgi:ATP-dependent RNA helicase DeaD